MKPNERKACLESQFVGSAQKLLPWLLDVEVTDIFINGLNSFYVERSGVLYQEDPPFGEAAALSELIERILIPIGKRVDASQPYLDGRLQDGSRFHLVLPPAAPGGPHLSIRKWRAAPAAPLESFSEPTTIEWLVRQVGERRNILICGATGSGKTTLLSRLLDEVGENERLILLEETLEIVTKHPHVVRLEARPPTPDGVGGITLRTLVRQSLRMRPDRLIVGESRGAEAFEILQAMNTGHSGSFSTVHASSALDGLKRLESLVLLAGFSLTLRAIREWIGSNIDVVVFLKKSLNYRKISEILLVRGLEGDVYRILPWKLGGKDCCEHLRPAR